MKSLLIRTLAFCAFLLPTMQAQTAGEGSTFGGFTPNQKFTLKVSFVGSGTRVGNVTKRNPQIPAGFPKLKVKQNVQFTIGDKGQLTGPGFSIPFNLGLSKESRNDYRNFQSSRTESLKAAVIFKNMEVGKKGEPTGGTVVLTKFTGKGSTVAMTSVTYAFSTSQKAR